MKPKVAIYSLTCCAGCQLEVLDTEEFLEIAGLVDIVRFPIVIAKKEEGPFYASFVEGMVTTPEEIETVKKVRRNSKFLVAIGACATYGGVPTIRNTIPQRKAEEIVYGKDAGHIVSIKPAGIGEYVEVDYYVHGCPIIKHEFVRVVKALLAGIVPLQKDEAVCTECKMKGNKCLFKEQICMGPLIQSGCDATCPSVGLACYGCRGPKEDSNVDEFIMLARKQGYKEGEIRNLLGRFACTAKQFKKYLD